MGQEIFPVMRGGVGMGQEKSMRGGDEDLILRPRFTPLPSLPVRMQDLAIFEKIGCGCGEVRQLKNY